MFRDFNALKSGYLPLDMFYAKLLCWKDYEKKKNKELQQIVDSANMIVESKNLEYSSGQGLRGNSLGKKRPITAVVAGAKNLKNLKNR